MAHLSNNLVELTRAARSFEDQGRDKPVLDGIGFSLSLGESLAVIGPSGCGKTTLLLMISGLLPPTGGQVHLKGRPARSGNRTTALVLQDYGLFPWKTVRQNILLGALVRQARISLDEVKILEKELGIQGLGHLYPQQISGGQRQRVALARALLLSPELLLLDEPFAALDALTRERLQTALLNLFQKRRFSFIVVTHSIEEAVILGGRIMILAGQPARVAGILENPTFGSPDPRVSPDFFDTCVSLRHRLGEHS